MATKDWIARTSDVHEGARRQWRADRALRPPMRSPGRPEPSREVQRGFWRLIATGITSAEAALKVGVSVPVGTRWFRHAGGMPPLSLNEPSGRYLSFEEREEIAILRATGLGVRQIARELGRDPRGLSRGNCGATLQPAAGNKSIGRWWRSGKRNRPRSARKLRNSSLTWCCVSMCRSDSPATFAVLTDPWLMGRHRCRGKG